MSSKLFKGAFVVLGAIVLSTLGIFASDIVRGIDGNVALLIDSKQGPCPAGMTYVSRGERSFCIDTYEVSPGTGCPHAAPRSSLETEANIAAADCYAASAGERTPWRFISLQQAQRMCANVGKRLPTNDEWYDAALGTTDSKACATDIRNGPRDTGAGECTSAAGAHDMVGNVWEWVDETVTDRLYAGRELPEEGYVHAVDGDGVAIETADTGSETHGDDYFWSRENGVYGMIRGGFYGGGSDAGLFSLNASVDPSFASAGVGFRCVKDV